MTNNITKFDEKEDVLVEDVISTGERSHLVVYNDDYNTFDWVIKCFMDVCENTQEKSEQL